MKLGPVTRLDKENKANQKKVKNGVMPENCDVIFIFPTYGQFGAIWKPDFERIACKTYIAINSYLSFYKNRQQI